MMTHFDGLKIRIDKYTAFCRDDQFFINLPFETQAFYPGT